MLQAATSDRQDKATSRLHKCGVENARHNADNKPSLRKLSLISVRSRERLRQPRGSCCSPLGAAMKYSNAPITDCPCRPPVEIAEGLGKDCVFQKAVLMDLLQHFIHGQIVERQTLASFSIRNCSNGN